MRLFSINIFIVIILLCSFGATAEEKIKEIKVLGNRRILTKTILYYSKIHPNDTINENIINQSLRNIYLQGLFSRISISNASNKIITIKVKENPLIKKITIEGSKKIKKKILKNELQVKEGSIYSKFQIDNTIKKIEETYNKIGYPIVSIYYTLKSYNRDSVYITIHINEGEKPKIKQICFYGNNNYSRKELLKVIQYRRYPWYKLFFLDDVYHQYRIILDKELLRRHYLKKGYADFQHLSSTLEITPDKKLLIVSHVINEGSIFSFGKSTFIHKVDGISQHELQNLVKYKEKDNFNETSIDDTIRSLVKFFYGKGYTTVRVHYKLKKDVSKKIINVNFIISNTTRHLIKKINITGNDRTIDKVIRRELTIYEGDYFDLSKVRKSKKKVRNLGYFNSVIFYNKKLSHSSNEVSIHIKLREISTGSMRFALGYNSGLGVIGSATFSEYNFLGKGQVIELDINKAKKRVDTYFSFTEPKFMDYNLSLGLDIFSTSQDKSKKIMYDNQSKGLSLRLGYNVNDFFYHKIHYSLKNEKTDQDHDPLIPSAAFHSNAILSSISHSLIYDSLNDKANPIIGQFTKINQCFTGVGGNTRYLKNELFTTYYRNIYKRTIIINLVGRAGIIQELNKNSVRVSDAFFVGEEYIRGFSMSGIGPKVGKHPVGGKVFITGTTEIHFPLGLPEELGVKGVIFYDFGTLYDCSIHGYQYNELLHQDMLIKDSKKLRSSCGIGFIWDSPLGKIKLDYGMPLKKESFDNISRVRFSVGTNF